MSTIISRFRRAFSGTKRRRPEAETTPAEENEESKNDFNSGACVVWRTVVASLEKKVEVLKQANDALEKNTDAELEQTRDKVQKLEMDLAASEEELARTKVEKGAEVETLELGKRKTKALQKRPYQAPQITKLIRPPAVGPVHARPESESMEIDEDSTATVISTEKPTETKLEYTTWSDYKSAEIAFPDGRKSVVKFGSVVNVRYTLKKKPKDVKTCYALVREIRSVRRNDKRRKSLGKEATEEQVGSKYIFNVSWLLHVNDLTKPWHYEPSYPIPDNERFYDPHDIQELVPQNVTCVEPVWFLSASSAIPPESSKQLFVNKIVGTKSRAGETSKFVYSMTAKHFCDQHKEHIERVRTLLAPKEEDVAGLFEV
jgi:hypothetical protein